SRRRGAAQAWLALPALEVRDVRARYPQRTAHVGLVRFSDMGLSLIREANGTLNWQRVADSLRAHADTTRSTAPPWTAVVDTFEIANATLAVTDRSITPAATVDLTQVLLRLTNASTDSTVRAGVEVGAA